MLKLENVTKYYGNFLAVDNLSFEVNDGEIFGLLGVNGAGKTTTFRMIINLLEPTKGKITLDGKPIDYSQTDKIGFLTEERSLLTKLTVKEQCLFYGALKGMDDNSIIEKMKYLLEKFGVSQYENRKIKELSKGNQQKIQFITAILNDPKLLILDEPFSGLDPFNVELFKNEIIEMSKKGSIIIFSSHRMEHVELFCKKIAILLQGKNVLSGNIKDIKEKYRKKNIFIKGDITKEELLTVKGVIDVIEHSDELEVKIEDEGIVPSVFKKIKNKDITKFVVEEPSLNEIFVAKVGEAYEK
ncbi:MAG: ATP-binding cassette domain-containing protein [Clostridium sp.]|nr:ATP-binding cassette domain-containing protein [Clostridium sp.]MCM1444331.1 ATP-binding cassette domain-containing protein [Candidatus Amulumruptor caecigallinarius]